MDNSQLVYKGEFTIEERKAMTAEVLQELRKNMKLSQKEVAGMLNIPATTYNTYESGRTEAPIEILVRLSHLYDLPVDIIVQRDRTYRTADDLKKQIAEHKEKLAEFNKAVEENGFDDPFVSSLLDSLKQLTTVMVNYSQAEAIKKAIADKKN